jgi:hypothetical protein
VSEEAGDGGARRQRRRRRGGGERPAPAGASPASPGPGSRPTGRREPAPARAPACRRGGPGSPPRERPAPPRERPAPSRERPAPPHERPAPPRPASPAAAAAADLTRPDEDLADEPRFVPEPDDDRPAAAITLAADLPAEPDDDLDPVTRPLLGAPDDDDDGAARLAEPVLHVVGVRLAPAGKLLFYDAGEQRLAPGERVVVDSERGPRLATVALASERRPAPGGERLRRVLRRAGPADLRA